MRAAFLLLLAECAGASAQRPSPKGALVPRDTVEALKRIEQEIGAANIRRDKAYFAQVESEEFLFTGANGGRRRRRKTSPGSTRRRRPPSKATSPTA